MRFNPKYLWYPIIACIIMIGFIAIGRAEAAGLERLALTTKIYNQHGEGQLIQGHSHRGQITRYRLTTEARLRLSDRFLIDGSVSLLGLQQWYPSHVTGNGLDAYTRHGAWGVRSWGGEWEVRPAVVLHGGPSLDWIAGWFRHQQLGVYDEGVFTRVEWRR